MFEVWVGLKFVIHIWFQFNTSVLGHFLTRLFKFSKCSDPLGIWREIYVCNSNLCWLLSSEMKFVFFVFRNCSGQNTYQLRKFQDISLTVAALRHWKFRYTRIFSNKFFYVLFTTKTSDANDGPSLCKFNLPFFFITRSSLN